VDAEVERIAERIRRYRTSENLTLQELGDRAGVSASTIHKIENGQTVPTISVLLKVAIGLRRPAAELFDGDEKPDVFRHVRAKDAIEFGVRGGTRVERITGGVSKSRIDVWRVCHDPGEGTGLNKRISYDGEVIIFIESGALRVTVEDQVADLEIGDTLHFRTHHLHQWKNVGDVPTTALFFGTMSKKFDWGGEA